MTQKSHLWLIDSGVVSAVDQGAVDLAIKAVLKPLDGKDEELARLAGNWNWDLVVSAHSDSSQGGLVISPAVMLRAGQLGLHLLCSVYLDPDIKSPNRGTSSPR